VCYGERVTRLYSDTILDRFRHPRHQGELTSPDGAHEDVNPLCGDRIRVEVRLQPGSPPTIEAMRYRGDACAIALASADLLAGMVEGRSPDEATRVDRETLLRALGAEIRPTRLRCVTLPLDVFRAALAAAAADGVPR
jgi:nitrogen fixation protein NifU and related proteins